MGDVIQLRTGPCGPFSPPAPGAPASEPALAFALTSGLAGAASAALDQLVALDPELGFCDLLADARGERELPWSADPQARAAVRELCLARQERFAGLPALPPPPSERQSLESWAASFEQLPLLSLCAGTTLQRWLPDPARLALSRVPLGELLTDPAQEAGARRLASNYLWAQALIRARARDAVSAVSPVSPFPEPPVHPGRRRADEILAALELAIARGRRRFPHAPSPRVSAKAFDVNPAQGELRIDWLRDSFRQWTSVSIEEGHEGETRCDCPSDGDCPHPLWSWESIAEALRGDLDHLPPKVLDFLATPAWRRRLAALDQALSHSSACAPEQMLLSWQLTEVGGVPQLVPMLHHLNQGGSLSAGRRLLRLEQARAHDFPHRDQVLALMSIQRSVPFPSINVGCALGLLSGFPRLFLDGVTDRPLEVRRGTLDLSLRGSGPERLTLLPRVDGDEGLGRKLIAATRQGATRILLLPEQAACVLVEMTEAQQTVFDALDLGLELGADELEAFRPRLAKLERHVPIHLPDGIDGEFFPNDPEVRLQLRAEEGLLLRAELRVRPLPTGASLVPGAGEAVVGAYVGGLRRQSERDLKTERRRAADLADWLELPGGVEAGFGWDLRGEAALDLLTRLRYRLPDQPVVEWIGERRIEMLRSPALEQLALRIEGGARGFRLAGEIAFGDDRLPLAEALAAVRSRSRWVQVAPRRWTELTGELRRRLERAAEVVHPGRLGLRVSAAAAVELETLCNGAGRFEPCAGWKAVAERLKRSRRCNPKPPAGLQAELRGYQVEGFLWLSRMAAWGAGAWLADEVELGKRPQALAVLLGRAARGPGLVVAPTAACVAWLREAERCRPGLEPVAFGETDPAATLAALGPGSLLVCSYELLVRHAEELRGRSFASLVLDEAQGIGNPATRLGRAACSLDAEWKLALTGAPIEDDLGELWSLFQLLDPGLLGSHGQFHERFAGPIEQTGDPARRAALSRVLRPFVLRRTRAEVAPELPAGTGLRPETGFSAAERELFDEARRAALEALPDADEAEGAQGFEEVLSQEEPAPPEAEPPAQCAPEPESIAQLALRFEIELNETLSTTTARSSVTMLRRVLRWIGEHRGCPCDQLGAGELGELLAAFVNANDLTSGPVLGLVRRMREFAAR